MVDIDKLKIEIVQRLKPLDLDKIILFGSFAYGTPNDDSDIDLFLVKDELDASKSRDLTLSARKLLREVIYNYETNGIDIITASSDFLNSREDYFYKVDVLQNGKVWYERNSG